MIRRDLRVRDAVARETVRGWESAKTFKNRLTSASSPVAEDTVWVIPGERAVRGLYRRWREGKTRAGSPASSALSE